MKDFTKTQPKHAPKGHTGALKCDTCGTVVNAFGVELGDSCSLRDYPGHPQGLSTNSDARGVNPTCPGKYTKISDESADQAKRRSDDMR